KIYNESGITAEKLTIIFTGTIDKTNFIAQHDWDDQRNVPIDKTLHTWMCESEKIVSGYSAFSATTFEISTNQSNPWLDAAVDVFSSTSRVQKYALKFLYLNISNDDFEKMT